MQERIWCVLATAIVLFVVFVAAAVGLFNHVQTTRQQTLEHQHEQSQTPVHYAPAISISFEPVNGGYNQACRGSSNLAGDMHRTFSLHKNITSLDKCKDTCLNTRNCKGYEYHADLQRCEVWKQAIKTSVHATGFFCFRHVVVTTTTLAAKETNHKSRGPWNITISHVPAMDRGKKDIKLSGFRANDGAAKPPQNVSQEKHVHMQENTPQSSLHRTNCTKDGEDCRSSKCCKNIGKQCFRKHQFWASCLSDCDKSIKDSVDGLNWECVNLGFRTIDGSKNRACRGKGNIAGDMQTTFTLKLGVTSVESCQSICAHFPNCTGIEYCEATHRCEVWKKDITSSVPAKGFVCMKYSEQGDMTVII